MLWHRSLVGFFGPALAAGSAGTLPARRQRRRRTCIAGVGGMMGRSSPASAGQTTETTRRLPGGQRTRPVKGGFHESDTFVHARCAAGGAGRGAGVRRRDRGGDGGRRGGRGRCHDRLRYRQGGGPVHGEGELAACAHRVAGRHHHVQRGRRCWPPWCRAGSCRR